MAQRKPISMNTRIPVVVRMHVECAKCWPTEDKTWCRPGHRIPDERDSWPPL
jgi:hypothetical protein